MFDKTVKNDPSYLDQQRSKLKDSRSMFGDVNLQIVNTINGISGILEGDQKNYVCENTFQTISRVQSAISTIDDLERYLLELETALESYLSYSFQEV